MAVVSDWSEGVLSVRIYRSQSGKRQRKNLDLTFRMYNWQADKQEVEVKDCFASLNLSVPVVLFIPQIIVMGELEHRRICVWKFEKSCSNSRE